MTPLQPIDRPSEDGVSRRDFLRVGGLSVLGLSSAERCAEQRALAEARGKGQRRCIFLLLSGGPSHFETFDPKPNAPAEIRGPFRAISTATPSLHFSETLPLLAQRTQHLAVLRSLWHDATPIHETGQQLIQTGRLLRGNFTPPSLGSMVSWLLGRRGNLPPYAVLPAPLGNFGVKMWQGQRAGDLGDDCNPWDAPLAESASLAALAAAPFGDELRQALNWRLESESTRRQYGDFEFGRGCLLARRLVERGVRFVTVNMYDCLAERITWDCHAHHPAAPATLHDYRNRICPEFDQAFSALLDDLQQRGLLRETLVVAVGEFGRTPRLNEHGGRDHWSGVWSGVLAGGGISGGQCLGASDAHGTAPADRPIEPAELAATILHSLGVDPATPLTLPNTAEPVSPAPPLVEREPIAELI